MLVSTRILDVGLMSGMAERAGGAVAISDGQRLLVAATTGAAGGADDLAALKQAVDLPAPGSLALGGQTVAALPLSGGGLRVLVSVAAPISAPGRHAAAVVGAGDPDHRRRVFDRPVRAGVAACGRRPDRGAGARPVGRRRRSRLIGRYTIVERIGQGGMAEIYAAVTQGEGSFRRPVVIKRLRPELTIDDERGRAVLRRGQPAGGAASPEHRRGPRLRPLAGPIFPGRGVRRWPRSRPRRRAPFRAGAPGAPGRGHRLRRRRAAQGAGVRARPDQRDGTAARASCTATCRPKT